MRVWLVRLCVAALVLAIGIGLGSGPLQHSARERDRELAAKQAEVARAESRIADLTAAGEYASDFATATAPALVAGKLSGRTVGLIQLPGASAADVDALRDLLEKAGAAVTTEVTLDPQLATTASRQLVEALTSQMAAQNKDLDIPADAAGYQRFGLLLARAVAADRGAGPKGSSYDQTAVGIASGLEAADLVTVSKASPRASLTVFVAGPAARSEAAAAENQVPVTVIAAYAGSAPTVLAGPVSAAGERGVVGALRADRTAAVSVPTVDSVDTPMGRVAVVLALVARIAGRSGEFGGRDAADGPVP